MGKLSLPKKRIKILLLEGIHATAVELFKRSGYTAIETASGALGASELKKKLRDVHILGVRSRTKLTADILEADNKFLTVGCFCIGTNQVDLRAAKTHGIPVFNAPYSNTWSVAELVVAEIIMLFRRFRNVPGVLANISDVFSSRKINIAGQYLRTDEDIGYVVTDVVGRVKVGMGIRRELEAIPGTLRTRFLYEAAK